VNPCADVCFVCGDSGDGGDSRLNKGSPRHHTDITSYSCDDKPGRRLEALADLVITKTGCDDAVMTRKPCIYQPVITVIIVITGKEHLRTHFAFST
jgi:hypothetical protein